MLRGLPARWQSCEPISSGVAAKWLPLVTSAIHADANVHFHDSALSVIREVPTTVFVLMASATAPTREVLRTDPVNVSVVLTAANEYPRLVLPVSGDRLTVPLNVKFGNPQQPLLVFHATKVETFHRTPSS